MRWLAPPYGERSFRGSRNSFRSAATEDGDRRCGSVADSLSRRSQRSLRSRSHGSGSAQNSQRSPSATAMPLLEAGSSARTCAISRGSTFSCVRKRIAPEFSRTDAAPGGRKGDELLRDRLRLALRFTILDGTRFKERLLMKYSSFSSGDSAIQAFAVACHERRHLSTDQVLFQPPALAGGGSRWTPHRATRTVIRMGETERESRLAAVECG